MHPQLNDLEAKKNSVEITRFSNKINLQTQQDDVLIKKNKATSEDSQEEIQYTKIEKTAVEDAPIEKISEIKKKHVKSLASLICYVPVNDHIKSQFKGAEENISQKTEVLVNDESGSIEIVFWKDAFQNIHNDGEGVYEI